MRTSYSVINGTACSKWQSDLEPLEARPRVRRKPPAYLVRALSLAKTVIAERGQSTPKRKCESESGEGSNNELNEIQVGSGKLKVALETRIRGQTIAGRVRAAVL